MEHIGVLTVLEHRLPGTPLQCHAQVFGHLLHADVLFVRTAINPVQVQGAEAVAANELTGFLAVALALG